MDFGCAVKIPYVDTKENILLKRKEPEIGVFWDLTAYGNIRVSIFRFRQCVLSVFSVQQLDWFWSFYKKKNLIVLSSKELHSNYQIVFNFQKPPSLDVHDAAKSCFPPWAQSAT